MKKYRSRQRMVFDNRGRIVQALVPNSTTGYLWTIVGQRGQVTQADFARELYGEDCPDPRHSTDWLDWNTRPKAQTAWEIGETMRRLGVRHASGLLMLLAASRLVDFAATFILLDHDVVDRHARHLLALIRNALTAVRPILLDSTPLATHIHLGGDEDRSEEVRRPASTPLWKEYAPYINIKREATNLRRRAAARAVWNLDPEVHDAAGESFNRWRCEGRRIEIDGKRAACALAIAEETRMITRDREDMTLEALCTWLRELAGELEFSDQRRIWFEW